MDAAVELREQILRVEDVKISFNDLVVKACAKALTRFPMVDASWMGDRIATHAEVHIGVAVAMPDGLIAPVVRNADQKAILDISREVKDLAARARDEKLKPEEFMGSTFSISNLGMFDVTEFTAIINPPESAILAVGAVRKIPVVDGDDIRIGHRMNVYHELRPPRGGRRPRRAVPERSAPAAGVPGQPVRLHIPAGAGVRSRARRAGRGPEVLDDPLDAAAVLAGAAAASRRTRGRLCTGCAGGGSATLLCPGG